MGIWEADMSESTRGRWITNCSVEVVHEYLQSLNGGQTVEGMPQTTEKCTQQQLVDWEIRGIYEKKEDVPAP